MKNLVSVSKQVQNNNNDFMQHNYLQSIDFDDAIDFMYDLQLFHLHYDCNFDFGSLNITHFSKSPKKVRFKDSLCIEQNQIMINSSGSKKQKKNSGNYQQEKCQRCWQFQLHNVQISQFKIDNDVSIYTDRTSGIQHQKHQRNIDEIQIRPLKYEKLGFKQGIETMKKMLNSPLKFH